MKSTVTAVCPSEHCPSEHEEQRALVEWWRKTRKERIFAIPNGGARSKIQGAKFKAEGVSPGVPDLCIPELGVYIEMKRQKGGSLSPYQKDWIAYLEAIGYTVIIGKGFEDARRQLDRL